MGNTFLICARSENAGNAFCNKNMIPFASGIYLSMALIIFAVLLWCFALRFAVC